MTTNEDIDYGEITEALNDKADRDFHNLDNSASVPYHIAVESNLQEQIDALSAKSDIADIVGTYADLTNYDKTKLSNNDIIQVLQDSTHDNATSYYKYVSASNDFSYIGSTSATYTKTEADNRYVHLTGNETIEGIKTFTSPFYVVTDTAVMNIRDSNYTKGSTATTDEYISLLQYNDKDGKILINDYNYIANNTTTVRYIKRLHNNSSASATGYKDVINAQYDGTTASITFGVDNAFAPTPASNSNDTNIATTAWVMSKIAGYITEYQNPSSSNSYRWYMKFNSGLIIQGGSNAATGTITLVKSYSNANYTVVVMNTDSTSYPNCGWVSDKTTTNFKANTLNGGTHRDWIAIGV